MEDPLIGRLGYTTHILYAAVIARCSRPSVYHMYTRYRCASVLARHHFGANQIGQPHIVGAGVSVLSVSCQEPRPGSW